MSVCNKNEVEKIWSAALNRFEAEAGDALDVDADEHEEWESDLFLTCIAHVFHVQGFRNKFNQKDVVKFSNSLERHAERFGSRFNISCIKKAVTKIISTPLINEQDFLKK